MTKVTIEIDGEKPIVLEGNQCIIAVSNPHPTKLGMLDSQLVWHGNYNDLCRMIIGESAQLNRWLNEQNKEDV